MPPRANTLAIIAVTVAGLIGLLYASSQLFLLNSFRQAEDEKAQRDVERVLDTLSAEISHLDTIAHDWAAWDDTYDLGASL